MNTFIKMKGRIYTLNLVPGEQVYEERLVDINKREYREWEPRRSKLGAGIMRGLENPIRNSTKILYLGAASGTTVSHISDMAVDGRIYAVEFAPEPMKYLVLLSMKRKNIIPIFADANKPDDYPVEKVDIVFQDIAQKNQVEIFTKNCKAYLKREGLGILALKARSVDVTKNPAVIFKNVDNQLSKNFKILKSSRLEPFERDHKMYLVKMK